MGISYGPLAKTLHNLGKTRHDLQKYIGLSAATVTKIGKNQYVALEVIDKICFYLNCDINDVIEHDKSATLTTKRIIRKSPLIKKEASDNAAQV
ncbi:MAG: hypothetical protein A4E55_00257 [Pelotomaculum sp. PtaU1.Bin035]|nr:MAG: hypothetical protein A4E55_00257 [Pelotomaculum sp. PtaU1.Bin035]